MFKAFLCDCGVHMISLGLPWFYSYSNKCIILFLYHTLYSVQEDAVRTVLVRGEEVPVKAIYLQDESLPRCKVTLWRDLTAVDIRPGDYVTVTNVVTNNYKNEVSLSGTNRTEVQVCCLPVYMY